VQRRADDVAGVLPGDLDDIRAQVGLEHVQTVALQRRVEADLFGERALALDDAPRLVPVDQVQDEAVGLTGILRPQHVHAVGLHPGFRLFEQVGKVAQGAAFGLGSLLAHVLAVLAPEGKQRLRPRSYAVGGRNGQRRL